MCSRDDDPTTYDEPPQDGAARRSALLAELAAVGDEHADLCGRAYIAIRTSEPMDVARLAQVLDGWFVIGDERWRLVPMSEDGGLSITSPASYFADAIVAALAEVPS